MTKSLITRYRPTRFSEVVGNKAQVKALEKVLKKEDSHTFLITGPSGVGKTTLARIIGSHMKVEAAETIEIDAATYTGIDAMRKVVDGTRYMPFVGKRKLVIVDEAHALSKSAWSGLLKSIEEPPEYVYWVFCTTEPGRVPQTIKTRCTSVHLKSVPTKDMEELYDTVAEAEGIELHDDIIDLVIREANGSPRQLLDNLSLCRDVSNKRDATEILRAVSDTDATYELCQFLAKGGSWQKAMGILAKLEDENPESVRIVVSHYFAAAARKATSDRSAGHFLTILDNFSEPYNPQAGQAPLILSIGQVLLGGE